MTDAAHIQGLPERIRSVGRQVAGSAQIGQVITRLPATNSERVLGALPTFLANVIAPRAAGPRIVGLGAAAKIVAEGRGRFGEVRRDAAAVDARIVGDRGSEGPVFLGGFAFEDSSESDGVFSDFGAARFVLPQFTFIDRPECLEVRIAFTGQADIDAIIAQLMLALEALRTQAEPAVAGGRADVPNDVSSEDDFAAFVEAAVSDIHAGDLSKLVVSQHLAVSLDAELSGRDVLSALAAEGDAVTRFLFSSGGSRFVGATPERLISLSGRSLSTEALAGTARDAHRLRASAKDQREQAHVAAFIKERLSEICADLDVPDAPQLIELRGLFHLITPIRGRLESDHHVLELVERLHPTPATAGVPAARARARIRSIEARPRGWYAGPVGWFDAAGSGEFHVALRCGLLRRQAAHLFVGAGVVEGSSIEAETMETKDKAQAMLRALAGARA